MDVQVPRKDEPEHELRVRALDPGDRNGANLRAMLSLLLHMEVLN